MRHLLCSFTALAMTVGLSAQNTWYVDPAGSNGNTGTGPGAGTAFETINHANSVAGNGDVIRLAAATFGDEQGIVTLGDKDLTILGEGSDATIIQANSTLTTNVNTGWPGTPVATQQRPVVLIEGPGRVDFRDICIDGNFAMPANGRLVGLFFRNGADGLVERCEIKNCRADPLSSANGAAGVIARGDAGGDATDVKLRNAFVHDFGKTGVVNFFNSTLQVEESRVVGSGHVSAATGIAQNGIQVSFGASAVVRLNTITNLFYDGITNSATGLLAYNAASVVKFDDNNIGNCELGMSLIYDATYPGFGSAFVPVDVWRNRVHCSTFAIQLLGLSFAHIENNSFHVSDCLALKVAYDDQGNKWVKNSYSNYQGGGTHQVSGPGGNVDPNARGGVDLVSGTPVSTALPVGHSPIDLVVADLDGIGGDDFATIELNAGASLSVGLNDNAGGFSPPVNQAFAGALDVPVAIVSGEFDANPGIDLAVLTRRISAGPNSCRVFMFGNDGSGGFTLSTTTLLAGFFTATDLDAGLVDADANTDLVATGATASAGIAKLLDNNGFGAFAQSTLPGSYLLPVRGAAIADLNGDNDSDIALIEGDLTTGRMHLLAGIGTTAFGAFGSSPLTIDPDPTAIADSDLDGDGDCDLVVTFGTFSGGAAEVFENDGLVSFASSRCNIDGNATAVAVGNLDNDSDPDSTFGDAAIVSSGSLSLLATFVEGAGFGAGGLAACNVTPTAAAFGDFDGNPLSDLFYSDSTGKVVVLPGVVQARTDFFGFGCPGTKERIPYLRPRGNPGAIQPNSSYGLEIDNAKPQSLAAIVAATAPAPVLVPCAPQIAVFTNQLFAVLVITNQDGEAGFGLPLAAAPSLAGFPFFCQAAVIDPAAPAFLPGLNLSLSKGLKIRIGN